MLGFWLDNLSTFLLKCRGVLLTLQWAHAVVLYNALNRSAHIWQVRWLHGATEPCTTEEAQIKHTSASSSLSSSDRFSFASASPWRVVTSMVRWPRELLPPAGLGERSVEESVFPRAFRSSRLIWCIPKSPWPLDRPLPLDRGVSEVWWPWFRFRFLALFSPWWLALFPSGFPYRFLFLFRFRGPPLLLREVALSDSAECVWTVVAARPVVDAIVGVRLCILRKMFCMNNEQRERLLSYRALPKKQSIWTFYS